MRATITIKEYAQAVQTLLPVAMSDTGQSRICAQVLLSAYNGNNFQLDVSALGGLDCSLFEAAIIVIQGRTDCRTEPHELVPYGDRLFMNLHEDWIRLHVKQRHKVRCPQCDGYGRVYDADDRDTGKCSRCEGDGRICSCGA